KKKGGKLAETTKTTVTISDTVAGHAVDAKGEQIITKSEQYVGPARWQDEYHRFRLELPNGPLYRKQEFLFEGAIVKGLDGKHRWYKADVQERDPQTHEVIPATGITYRYEFAFGEEVASVKVFHPRAVLAFDYRGAVGAGAEV